MATNLTIKEARVKVRSPWGVWGLNLITLGIYGLFWYYFINRELRDFGRTPPGEPDHIEVDPILSLLAITIGACILIPPFVSLWKTGKRIARAQALAGAPRMSMGVWLIMWLVPGVNLFWNVYAQSQLNAVWDYGSRMSSTPTSVPSAIPTPV